MLLDNNVMSDHKYKFKILVPKLKYFIITKLVKTQNFQYFQKPTGLKIIFLIKLLTV